MRILLPILFSTILAGISNAQSFQLTQHSVIKDSTGKIYDFETWRRLYWRGHDIKPIDPQNPKTEFLLTKLSDDSLDRKLSAFPKPKESSFFKTAEKIQPFTAVDRNGNKIDLKNLEGKIVVLNFWFINCAPCRIEMPDLNDLADSFKNNKNVVFIAIALDKKENLDDFLKNNVFKYQIIDDGGNIAAQYNVGSYPTHVVLNANGTVYFHTSGLAMNTIYWLKKSINQLLVANVK